MTTTLVFTIIGDDRPGLVEEIARLVNEQEANWLGSRLSRLGGKFAGIIQVEGSQAQLAGLRRSLEGLTEAGLAVMLADGGAPALTDGVTITVTLLGLDRPGIVREVAGALASRCLNVLDMQTSVFQAAMTGKLMFSGMAQVAVPEGFDQASLEQELDALSAELGIDIEVSD